MEYASRKRRKELKSTKDKETGVVKLSDEELFKEQKKRLRRQLNSANTFALDSNDMKLSPNSLQTRTEVKKQKKIDDILRDIAVLPENEYLNEDTNLRLLKKMSVAKQYNRLQLSPEQEEKMAENKEKFETITNQLWFLIAELEKGKVPEPGIGTVPQMASEDVARNRNFFDVETARTAEHQYLSDDDSEFVMTNINTKIDLLEEKLEKISLKNDELEDVLQDLEKVVQEGKSIVNEEVQFQEYDIGEAPDDTLELLEYLEKVEQLNHTKALKLDETRQNVLKTATDNPKVVEIDYDRDARDLLATGALFLQSEQARLEEAIPGKTAADAFFATTAVEEPLAEVPRTLNKTKLTSMYTDEVFDEEKLEKHNALQKSIIILSIIFVILLSILLFMLYNFTKVTT